MKNFNDDYYVGFDIGTDSVGYCEFSERIGKTVKSR